jgi:hypothetical protein
VAFSPDDSVLAVGCADGSVEFWADSQGQLKPTVVKKHQGLIWMLAFSPDGRTMASGSTDNNVVLWDVPTREDLMTLKHNGTVEALKFSPDGRILATAAHEPSRGDVCLWRAPLEDDGAQNSLRPTNGPSGPTGLGGPAFTNRSTGLDSRPTGLDSRPNGFESRSTSFDSRSGGLDSATAARPAYQDAVSAPSPGASSYQQPNSRPLDPSAPLPASGYPDAGDDRYGAAPLPGQRAPASTFNGAPASSYGGASTDPSVPLGAGNGASQPGAWQNNSGGQPRSGGGRHMRPAGQ